MRKGCTGELTDNEKFIVDAVTQPKKVSNGNITNVNKNLFTVSWDGITKSIFTSYKIVVLNKATLAEVFSKKH